MMWPPTCEFEETARSSKFGLALVGRLKGYRVLLVAPDKMSTEKVLHFIIGGIAIVGGEPRQ